MKEALPGPFIIVMPRHQVDSIIRPGINEYDKALVEKFGIEPDPDDPCVTFATVIQTLAFYKHEFDACGNCPFEVATSHDTIKTITGTAIAELEFSAHEGYLRLVGMGKSEFADKLVVANLGLNPFLSKAPNTA